HGILRFFLTHPELLHYQSNFWRKIAFAQEADQGALDYFVMKWEGKENDKEDCRFIDNMTVWHVSESQFKQIVGRAPYARYRSDKVKLVDRPKSFQSFMHFRFNDDHVINWLARGTYDGRNLKSYS